MFERYKSRNPKTILIVRSSAKLFPLVVEEARKAFIGTEIDVLTNLPTLPESFYHDAIAQVYHTATTGTFTYADVPLFQKEIKKKEYDLAIVLYNSRRGLSYLNIDSFAFGANANTVLSVNINKELRELSWGSYFFKWMHRVIDCFWVGINYVCVCCVLMCIFIGMLVTQPVIAVAKMRKRK